MSLEALKERLPEYAKDIKLNLGGLPQIEGLTPQQLWGSALVSAIASRNADVMRAIAAEAAPHLSPAAQRAVRGAAALMGMNNIYYRFVHLVGDEEYGQLPARLRMQLLGNPGIEKLDFELFSLAVSAINGCGSCVSSHEKVVKGQGATARQVQDVARIASVIHATAATLEAEEALGALPAAE